ncbi:MAG: hypothetical protein NTX19_03215 [Gemmatimonadetes bacterium]|nr:hypothetical protein [Gemmatimonadota bacterium]
MSAGGHAAADVIRARPNDSRGVTLFDVVASLRLAWRAPEPPQVPGLAMLPGVGARA